MKQLLIMRHAKSSWKNENLADHDRPLNPRGIENAPRMGQFVAEKQCLPALILSSTAARAISTARLFVEGCGEEIPIVSERSLYHPGIRDYTEAIYTLADDQARVMVVSHNPGSEEWIYKLTNVYERMPTASIAMVEFDSGFQWNRLNRAATGKLVDVWRPKEVL